MIGVLLNKFEMLLNKDVLDYKEKELFKKVKDLKLSERVHWYYNTYIQEIEDLEVVRKRLIRNIMLSKEGDIREDRPERRIFYYGNLAIIVDFYENEIVWIRNYYGKLKVNGIEIEEFTYDQSKREYLNRILGLRETYNNF